MYGNGLRPQLWKELVSRFNVDVTEFYGATEGNCSMGKAEKIRNSFHKNKKDIFFANC